VIATFQHRSPGKCRRLAGFRRWAFRAIVPLLLAFAPTPALGQFGRDSSTDWLMSAGSEGERYLRVMQITGQSTPSPWSVRSMSIRERRRLAPVDSTLPWAGRMTPRPVGSRWVRALQPELAGIGNSSFPYGFNDGPVWAGRGLTVSASAGLEGAIGPLEFELAPQVFWTSNGAFPLVPNGRPGLQAFGEAFSDMIDLPQRFGDGPYQRADPGQSSIRVHLAALAFGVSTANEAWGPAVENPFILGTNAAGFPHVFLGTDRPLTLGPVSGSLRVLVGRLDQSAYSVPTGFSHRSLAASVFSLGLSYLPGLEVGVARAFMSPWPDEGLSVSGLLRPLLQTPFKASLARKIGGLGNSPDDQLASVFARWSFPRSGVELYGELGKEDNSFDLRDLIEEPDHDVSYLVGFQRAWRRSPQRVLVLRGELMNSSISRLALVRPQEPAYTHSVSRQGYTQMGQALAAPAGFGGGGTVLALDWFSPDGRQTLTWRHTLRAPYPAATPRDVQHAVSAEWLLLRPRIDLVPEITGVYELNRPSWGDALNLRLALSARAHW
jgi:hypothetical protein